MSSQSERQRVEEYEEELLNQEYERIKKSPVELKTAAEYLYNQLIDELIMSICFRNHFESKNPEAFNYETDSKGSGESGNSSSKLVNSTNIKCPNCSKIVSANKFASHLERDMGLGRNSTRIASRKKTTNYEYESESAEEESDTNWNERKAKKKLSNGRNNGKSSKKSYM